MLRMSTTCLLVRDCIIFVKPVHILPSFVQCVMASQLLIMSICKEWGFAPTEWKPRGSCSLTLGNACTGRIVQLSTAA